MLFTPFTRRQLDETVADMISEEMINYETLLLLLAHFIDKSYDTESKHMFKWFDKKQKGFLSLADLK